VTVLAIVLAVAAAVVFGLAAVSQHQAVRRRLAPERRALRLRQIGGLVTDRIWLRGFALLVLGTGFHVAALSLAPISLTQPINVLAVPTTIIATAVLTRRRPPRSVIIAALAVVVGIAGLVSSFSNAPAGDIPTPALLGLVGACVATLTVGCHVIARRLLTGDDHRRSPRWLAPVLLGIAGAVNFGVTSSTFRLLAQDLNHAQPLPVGVVVALVCSIPVGLALGSWSIQQAYASGAAPAVTSTSALTDPIVALTIGMAVLGETPQLSVTGVVVMIIAAALAAVGVTHLAQHDDVAPGRAQSSPPAKPRPSRRTLLVQQTRIEHAHPAGR
jgi:drug/metabolite transporter (DMT)-like permease